MSYMLFFFNDTATTEIYTLSLHDALPIPGEEKREQKFSHVQRLFSPWKKSPPGNALRRRNPPKPRSSRSEEHTSELQSRQYLVCRLLLEKKQTTTYNTV